ncbi:MAG: arginine--tRNA ligase [Actinomycetota bacterium]|nr:arginine--tRNA ligase [Actinomycetota bacterium]
MSIEERLAALIAEALPEVALKLGIDGDLPAPEIIAPRQKEHGDFATNVALALAKRAGRPPREVAQAIADALPPAPFVEKTEVAGPGFLNFFTTDEWLHDALREVVARGDDYGRLKPNGQRTQVEFVSANPTGPLHIGHARNAALGDAIARLLEADGWSVEREYYFNDAGAQMELFGRSVEAWLLQLEGHEAEIPEEGYRGEYVGDIARQIAKDVTFDPPLVERDPDSRWKYVLQHAAPIVLKATEATLERFGVRFDSYLSERTLHEAGEIEQAVERLRASGHAYDADGATWFRSTEFGDDKDRVIVRSSGAHTYFAADCAYLIHKFGRGFDHVLYVWGADHHGDVVRVKGAASALGYDPEAVEIVIYQFVSFLRGGEPLKMSKRAGTFVTLDQLIDEVGADAARFTLLMFSNDSSMNFDIEVVKQQTMENPVYYVQYGHARIASILRKASERGIALGAISDTDLSLLTSEAELDLLRALAEVPEQMAVAASRRAPHRLTHASQDLASRFHRFYTECRVVSDDEELTQARLWLCSGTKQVIANLLGVLGVSAPESMGRTDA